MRSSAYALFLVQIYFEVPIMRTVMQNVTNLLAKAITRRKLTSVIITRRIGTRIGTLKG